MYHRAGSPRDTESCVTPLGLRQWGPGRSFASSGMLRAMRGLQWQ
jgi:hypothetical protein